MVPHQFWVERGVREAMLPASEVTRVERVAAGRRQVVAISTRDGSQVWLQVSDQRA